MKNSAFFLLLMGSQCAAFASEIPKNDSEYLRYEIKKDENLSVIASKYLEGEQALNRLLKLNNNERHGDQHPVKPGDLLLPRLRHRNRPDKTHHADKNHRHANPVNQHIGLVLVAFAVFGEPGVGGFAVGHRAEAAKRAGRSGGDAGSARGRT